MITEPSIHPTAIIDKNAKLADDVKVGPYSIIKENVTIGSGTEIGAHCVIEGYTRLGKNNKIFTGAVVGSIPQDLKYNGAKTFLEIGDNNIIREYVTINPGTEEGTKTIIGSNNELMAYVHVAHDCIVKNNIIIANVGTLAGHVTVEDRAVIGGLVAVHQFVRVGTMSIIGGCSKVVQDIVPYSISDGHPAKLYGLNLVGLRRANISKEARLDLKAAIKILSKDDISTAHAVEMIEAEINPKSAEILQLLQFVKDSSRGLAR